MEFPTAARAHFFREQSKSLSADVLGLFQGVTRSPWYGVLEQNVSDYEAKTEDERTRMVGSLMVELLKELVYEQLNKELPDYYVILDRLQTSTLFQRLYPDQPVTQQVMSPTMSGIVTPDLMVLRDTRKKLQLTHLFRVFLADRARRDPVNVLAALRDPKFLFKISRDEQELGSLTLTRHLREIGVPVNPSRKVVMPFHSQYRIYLPRTEGSDLQVAGYTPYPVHFNMHTLREFALATVVDRRAYKQDGAAFLNASARTEPQSASIPHPA